MDILNGKAVVVLCALMLNSCSTLDILKDAVGLNSSKGLSVDMQVGDRQLDTQISGTRGTGKISAKGKARVYVNTASNKFEKAELVIINETNPWVLGSLLAVVILFIPSPLPKIIRGTKWLATTRQRMSRKASEQK